MQGMAAAMIALRKQIIVVLVDKLQYLDTRSAVGLGLACRLFLAPQLSMVQRYISRRDDGDTYLLLRPLLLSF